MDSDDLDDEYAFLQSLAPANQIMQQGVSGPGTEISDRQHSLEKFARTVKSMYQQRANGEWRIGPNLQTIIALNYKRGARESYTLKHLIAVLSFQAQNDCTTQRSQLCKDIHSDPRGCKVCSSCHFCRQKTTEKKTRCACRRHRGLPGGPSRGQWCGQCLQARMGENIDEVINNPEWLCPCCRDICNCSCNNCLRYNKGLEFTGQLHYEAGSMGYKSVAHYLILTQLNADRKPEDIRLEDCRPLDGFMLNGVVVDGADGPANRGRNMAQQRTRLRETTAQKVQKQIDMVQEEFRLPDASTFQHMLFCGLGLGILDQDDDNDRSEPMGRALLSLPPGAARTHAPASKFARTHPHAGGVGGSLGSILLTDRRAQLPAAVPLHPTHSTIGQLAPPSGPGAAGPSQSMLATLLPFDGGLGGASAGGGLWVPHRFRPGAAPLVLGTRASLDQDAMLDAAVDWPGPVLLQVLPDGGQLGHAPGQATARGPLGIQLGLAPAQRVAEAEGGGKGGSDDGSMEWEAASQLPSWLESGRHRASRKRDAASGFTNQGGKGKGSFGNTLAEALHSDRTGTKATYHQRPLVPPFATTTAPAAAGHAAHAAAYHHQRGASPDADMEDQEQANNSSRGNTPRGQRPGTPTLLSGSSTPDEAPPSSKQKQGQQEQRPSHLSRPQAGGCMPYHHQQQQQQQQSPIISGGGVAAAVRLSGGDGTLRHSADHNNRGLELGVYGELLCMARDVSQQCDKVINSGSATYTQAKLDAWRRQRLDGLGAVLRMMEGAAESAAAVTDYDFTRTLDGRDGYDGGDATSPFLSHTELRHGVELLLLLAEKLPQEDVENNVVNLLFNRHPFVDFRKSDIRARGILANGAVQLLDVLPRRKFSTTTAVAGVLLFVSALHEEYVAWNDVFSLSLQIMKAWNIGGLHYPDASSSAPAPVTLPVASQEERFSTMQMLQQGDHELLRILLGNMQAACTKLGPNCIQVVQPSLVMLLLPAAKVEHTVRRNVAVTLFCAIQSMFPHLRGSPAGWVAEGQVTTQMFKEQIHASGLLPALEALVAFKYPVRRRSKFQEGLEGVLATIDNKLDADNHQVGSIPVELLGLLYASELFSASFTWSQVEERIMAPFAAGPNCPLWEHSPPSTPQMRTFATFLVGQLLKCCTAASLPAPAVDHNMSVGRTLEVPVWVLRVWLRACLDYDKRSALAWLTDSLCHHPTTAPLFAQVAAYLTPDAIAGDDLGQHRAIAVHHVVLAATQAGALYHPHYMLDRLEVVWSCRRAEVKRGELVTLNLKQRLCWETSCTAVALAALSALDQHGTGRFAAELTALKLLETAVQASCDFLKQLYVQYSAQKKGYDLGDDSLSGTEFNDALCFSPFGLLPEILSPLALILSKSNRDRTDLMLNAGRMLLQLFAALVELPQPQKEESHMDSALRAHVVETLLSPSPKAIQQHQQQQQQEQQQQQQQSAAAAIAPCIALEQEQLLHVLLSVHVRHYISSAATAQRQTAHAQRTAVNAIAFVRTLVRSPAFMSTPKALQRYLPTLFETTLAAMAPGHTVLPCMPVQTELFKLWSDILPLCGHRLPAAPSKLQQAQPGARSNFVLQTGALMTGAAVPEKILWECVEMMLHVLVHHALHCVATLPSIPEGSAELAASLAILNDPECWELVDLLELASTTSTRLLPKLGRPRPIDTDLKEMKHLGAFTPTTAELSQPAPPLGEAAWHRAEQALAFLSAATLASPVSGPSWAMKALPMLHYLLAGGAKSFLRPIHQHYGKLITALENVGHAPWATKYRLPRDGQTQRAADAPTAVAASASTAAAGKGPPAAAASAAAAPTPPAAAGDASAAAAAAAAAAARDLFGTLTPLQDHLEACSSKGGGFHVRSMGALIKSHGEVETKRTGKMIYRIFIHDPTQDIPPEATIICQGAVFERVKALLGSRPSAPHDSHRSISVAFSHLETVGGNSKMFKCTSETAIKVNPALAPLMAMKRSAAERYKLQAGQQGGQETQVLKPGGPGAQPAAPGSSTRLVDPTMRAPRPGGAAPEPRSQSAQHPLPNNTVSPFDASHHAGSTQAGAPDLQVGTMEQQVMGRSSMEAPYTEAVAEVVRDIVDSQVECVPASQDDPVPPAS